MSDDAASTAVECPRGSAPGLLFALLGFFFISGLASVAAEVVWARILHRGLGSTAISVATVLAGFLGGMGVGAYVAERLRERLMRPLRAYASTEFLAAVATIAATALLERSASWLALPGGEVAVLFVVVIASLPIGATLPLAIFALLGASDDGTSDESSSSNKGVTLDRSVRWLYGWNALGGGCGALLAGLLGVPFLGERATIAVVAGLQIAVAALAFWRFGRLRIRADAVGSSSQTEAASHPGRAGAGPPRQSGEQEEERSANEAPGPTAREAGLLPGAFLFLSGGVVFYWEVLWSRLLALTVGATVYAFAFVSASVIFGIGLGSLLFSRRRAAPQGLWLLPLIVAVLLAAGYFAVPFLPDAYLAGIRRFEVHPLVWGVAGAAAIPLLPNLLLGVLFPWVVSGRPDWVGRFYAINSLGSLLGAFLGGPVTASLCTLEDAYRWGVAALFALMSLGFCLVRTGSGRSRRPQVVGRLAVAFAPVVLVVLFFGLRSSVLRTPWDPGRLLCGVYQWAARDIADTSLDERIASREILHIEWGREVVVSVEVEPATNTVFVRGNGKVEGSVPFDRSRPSLADLPTQVLLGELPMALTSGRAAREVLLIGLGSGVTLGALLESKGDGQVDVIEIEKAFYDAVRSPAALPYLAPFLPSWFLSESRAAAEAKGCHLHFGDARRLLQGTFRERRWDVMVSQPSEPWIPGASGLFTEEFFVEAAAHLRDGGLFLQWLQLYKVEEESLRTLVRTFRRAFPMVYLARPPGTGELLLVGSLERLDLAPLLEAPSGRLTAVTGLEVPVDRLAIFVAGPRGVDDWVGLGPGLPVHRDGRSDLILRLTHSLYSERNLARENLRALQRLAGNDPILKYLDERFARDPRLRGLLAERNHHFGDLEEAIALLGDATEAAAVELRERCLEELRSRGASVQNR